MSGQKREATAVQSPVVEPVVRMGDKIAVHCPECFHLGTHTGTCSWSQMRTGRVWAFYAEAVDLIPHKEDDRG